MQYTEKSSLTSAAASIRMFLTKAATKNGEQRHFDVEETFLKVDIGEEIYIEISEEYQTFPRGVGC